ncbi:MAG TPA: virulence protein RhuM/Fic/DOC family protein [Desulforhopalus sp.]|nr:virulence protein RhuM/Fic/DOC family protein [Desulforhopalus sp.]
MSEIIIYEDPDAANPVQVTLDGDTVWLTQAQMAVLFGRERSVITRHIGNIFRDGELCREAVCAFFAHTAEDGKTYQVDHFNLDVIISVGYRVKSHRGVRFRQWATQVLRQHLLQGYTLNRQRLAERGMEEARTALGLLSRTLIANDLVNDTGWAVLELVKGYAKTWRLLLQYDDDNLPLPEGCCPARGVLACDRARAAIVFLKDELFARREATDLFGRERGEGLAAILGAIEQTMFGKPLYPSREIKAAHLLYFVIKDHPFSDGNKRIGSFLFLLYLQQEGMTSKIGDVALTALALLIAESVPASKELLIRLIVNLLMEL